VSKQPNKAANKVFLNIILLLAIFLPLQRKRIFCKNFVNKYFRQIRQNFYKRKKCSPSRGKKYISPAHSGRGGPLHPDHVTTHPGAGTAK
jgi:hypothetical protein